MNDNTDDSSEVDSETGSSDDFEYPNVDIVNVDNNGIND